MVEPKDKIAINEADDSDIEALNKYVAQLYQRIADIRKQKLRIYKDIDKLKKAWHDLKLLEYDQLPKHVEIEDQYRQKWNDLKAANKRIVLNQQTIRNLNLRIKEIESYGQTAEAQSTE